MTKQEFVEKVADKAGISKRDAAEAVDAFLDSITDTLRGGGEVSFTGFGKFTTQRRAARQGVNPRNPSADEWRSPRRPSRVLCGQPAQAGRQERCAGSGGGDM